MDWAEIRRVANRCHFRKARTSMAEFSGELVICLFDDMDLID